MSREVSKLRLKVRQLEKRVYSLEMLAGVRLYPFRAPLTRQDFIAPKEITNRLLDNFNHEFLFGVAPDKTRAMGIQLQDLTHE